MNRIRLLANITIFAIVPMTFYYIYASGGWALEAALLDPEWWMDDEWVDPAAIIAPLTRWVFFIVWVLPVGFGVISSIFAIWLALLVRRGILFDPRIARGLFWLGVSVAASAVAKLVAASVSPMIKSWHNPDGPLPMRFWYGSEEFGLIFCGLGFVVLGLVMREAIKLARENEAFV